MNTKRKPTENKASPAGTVIAFADAPALYPGKWVLAQILEWDAAHEPNRIQVLAVGATRKPLTRALTKQLPLPKKPPEHAFFVFKAEPLSTSGEELRLAILEASRPGTADARR